MNYKVGDEFTDGNGDTATIKTIDHEWGLVTFSYGPSAYMQSYYLSELQAALQEGSLRYGRPSAWWASPHVDGDVVRKPLVCKFCERKAADCRCGNIKPLTSKCDCGGARSSGTHSHWCNSKR